MWDHWGFLRYSCNLPKMISLMYKAFIVLSLQMKVEQKSAMKSDNAVRGEGRFQDTTEGEEDGETSFSSTCTSQK